MFGSSVYQIGRAVERSYDSRIVARTICPHCGAARGAACTTASGKETKPHQKRRDK